MLLTPDANTIMRRLFWEEDVRRFEPQHPRFACTCSRDRVTNMLRGLGREEADDMLAEAGQIEVGCEFCGKRYRLDPVDVGQMFTLGNERAEGSGTLQ